MSTLLNREFQCCLAGIGVRRASSAPRARRYGPRRGEHQHDNRTTGSLASFDTYPMPHHRGPSPSIGPWLQHEESTSAPLSARRLISSGAFRARQHTRGGTPVLDYALPSCTVGSQVFVHLRDEGEKLLL